MTADPSGIACPGCGVRIPDPKRFCRSCGAELPDPEQIAREARAREAQALAARVRDEGVPEDPPRATGRGARPLLLALAAVSVLGGLAGTYGRLAVRVEPPAAISLLRRGEVVAEVADGTDLVSGNLRSGPYTVRIAKPGFRTVEETAWAGVAFRRRDLSFTLEPVFGGARGGSDPPGARLVVRNAYGEHAGPASEGVEGVRAMESEVRLELDGYTPWVNTLPVPAGGLLDLGTVRFVGGLRFAPDPRDARVLLDGAEVGVGLTALDDLPARPTRLELRSGARAWMGSVDVPPGGTLDIGNLHLDGRGHLKVDAEPGPVDVVVDDKRIGRAPLHVDDLAPGRHRIQLYSFERRQWPHAPSVVEFDHTFAPGERLDLGIVPLTGALVVDSDPPGASVLIDGKRMGKAPQRFVGVPVGERLVSVVDREAGMATARVRVEGGKTADAGTLALQPRWSLARVTITGVHGGYDFVKWYLREVRLSWRGKPLPIRALGARRGADTGLLVDGDLKTGFWGQKREAPVSYGFERSDGMAFQADRVEVYVPEFRADWNGGIQGFKLSLSRDGEEWKDVAKGTIPPHWPGGWAAASVK